MHHLILNTVDPAMNKNIHVHDHKENYNLVEVTNNSQICVSYNSILGIDKCHKAKLNRR